MSAHAADVPTRAGRALAAAAGVALLATALVGVSGCAAEKTPSTTIRAFKEPTDTVGQLVEQPDDASAVATGALSFKDRREFEKQVRVLGVGYAAEGAYLIANFIAPPRLAILWQPGELYLVDEATGAKYDEIPFMPKIGFLIARPAEEGQAGYVMLQNQPSLRPGSEVTVVLGGFTQEHVKVEYTNAPAPPTP